MKIKEKQKYLKRVKTRVFPELVEWSGFLNRASDGSMLAKQGGTVPLGDSIDEAVAQAKKDGEANLDQCIKNIEESEKQAKEQSVATIGGELT